MNPRFLSIGVAMSSFATIALELTLTRIYSVTMYYHFAYMVISLALLGLAISGVAIYVLPKVFTEARSGTLAAVFMLLFSVSALWALSSALANPISISNWQANTGKLINIYLPAGVPFVCSGVAISLAIASAKENIGRIYAFDLGGAALGCLFIIPALPHFGGQGSIILVSAIGAFAAGAFALGVPVKGEVKRSPLILAASALFGVAFVFLAATEQTAHRFGLARNPEKFLGNNTVQFEKWNALSQITVAQGDRDHKWIYIDADAATRLWSGDIKAQGYAAPRRFGEVRVASLVYSIRHDGTALIIGPGGGTDVTSALFRGTPRVVGVEVNPIIVDSIMKDWAADYSGHLYSDPRVEVHVDEGRSFVRRSDEPYQSIQATLVDTWAASTSGAFTLSENNLYTVEAFGEFLDHLRPNGIVAVTRWYDAGSPKEYLRLVSIARTALEKRGVAPADVRSHIILTTDNERRANLLLGKAPFTVDDLKTIQAQAAADHLTVLYSPPADGVEGSHRDAFLTSFVEAPSMADFFAKLPYDASAPTDNKPFYFYTLRPGDLLSVMSSMGKLEKNNLGVAILIALLGVSSALTLVLVILPLVLFRRDALKTQRGPKLRVIGYFLALGLGFILVEMGFMQEFVLFLGHPIYALAVVLAVLLAASGTGSALSGWGCSRWGIPGFVRRAIGALAVVLVVYAFGLEHVFRALVGLVLPIRIVLAAILVFLPGVIMGSLLPSGVRTANAVGPGIVPWAWGLNGAASVVGSVLAITLSMNYGFTAALLVGIVVYGLGLLVFPTSIVADATPAPGADATPSDAAAPAPDAAPAAET